MADLYHRLVEYNEILCRLVDDVEQLRLFLGERDEIIDTKKEQEANRRFYVRSIFALVEALLEQQKQLLIDIVENRKSVPAVNIQQNLSEENRYFSTIEKISAVRKAAKEVFGQSLNISFGDEERGLLKLAIGIRNRLTHPKNSEVLYVSADELDVVDRAHEWFKSFCREFAQVATQHRKQNHW